MLNVIMAYITYPLVALVSALRSRRGNDSYLVFQTAKIGDMICTTPVFREIKKARPGCRLGVVADPLTVPLLKHNPHIDEIIALDRKMYRGLRGRVRLALELRSKGYAKAVIILPNTTNILAAFWAMIPVRVSVYPNFCGTTLRMLMALNTATEAHTGETTSIETYLRSLAHLGIRATDTAKEVYPAPGADTLAAKLLEGASGPPIGIVPGAGNMLKDWGADNYKRLCAKIIDETSAVIILIGSAKENEAAVAIMAGSAPGRVRNLCMNLTLLDAPALIKRLSLVIGVDTGVIYMADALGVPVIDIAGPCNMKDQRPTGPKSVIIQKSGLECVPCSHTFSAPYGCRKNHRMCITGITPEEVYDSVKKLIPPAGRAGA